MLRGAGEFSYSDLYDRVGSSSHSPTDQEQQQQQQQQQQRQQQQRQQNRGEDDVVSTLYQQQQWADSLGTGELGIRVMVRVRPILPQEEESSSTRESCVDIDDTDTAIRVVTSTENATEEAKEFEFHHVFDEKSTQVDVFTEVKDVVESVAKGFNGTIFAYGQTGSGKTHSMEGYTYEIKSSSVKVHGDSERHRWGLTPRCMFHLFDVIKSAPPHLSFAVKCSFIQIYNERVFDLLNPSTIFSAREGPDGRLPRTLPPGLRIRWEKRKGFFVENLFHFGCDTAEDVKRVFDSGVINKVMGSHKLNMMSSRSHTMFTLHVECSDLSQPLKEPVKSKLHLVDLAGSERLRQLAERPSAKLIQESIEINRSLFVLGKVISALSDSKKQKASHVPYRDSKLTRLLKDSLGGNSITVMLACVSPTVAAREETLNTLFYAGRARNIKNIPRINENPKDKLIRQLREQNISLRQELAYLRQFGNLSGGDVGQGSSTGEVPKIPDFLDLPGGVAGKKKSGAEPSNKAVDAELEDLSSKLVEAVKVIKGIFQVNESLREQYDVLMHNNEGYQVEIGDLMTENSQLQERIDLLEYMLSNSGAMSRASPQLLDSRPQSTSRNSFVHASDLIAKQEARERNRYLEYCRTNFLDESSNLNLDRLNFASEVPSSKNSGAKRSQLSSRGITSPRKTPKQGRRKKKVEEENGGPHAVAVKLGRMRADRFFPPQRPSSSGSQHSPRAHISGDPQRLTSADDSYLGQLSPRHSREEELLLHRGGMESPDQTHGDGLHERSSFNAHQAGSNEMFSQSSKLPTESSRAGIPGPVEGEDRPVDWSPDEIRAQKTSRPPAREVASAGERSGGNSVDPFSEDFISRVLESPLENSTHDRHTLRRRGGGWEGRGGEDLEEDEHGGEERTTARGSNRPANGNFRAGGSFSEHDAVERELHVHEGEVPGSYDSGSETAVSAGRVRNALQRDSLLSGGAPRSPHQLTVEQQQQLLLQMLSNQVAESSHGARSSRNSSAGWAGRKPQTPRSLANSGRSTAQNSRGRNRGSAQKAHSGTGLESSVRAEDLAQLLDSIGLGNAVGPGHPRTPTMLDAFHNEESRGGLLRSERILDDTEYEGRMALLSQMYITAQTPEEKESIQRESRLLMQQHERSKAVMRDMPHPPSSPPQSSPRQRQRHEPRLHPRRGVTSDSETPMSESDFDPVPAPPPRRTPPRRKSGQTRQKSSNEEGASNSQPNGRPLTPKEFADEVREHLFQSFALDLVSPNTSRNATPVQQRRANSPLADYLMHRVDSPRNAFSGGGGFASGSSSSASDALGIPYGLAGLSRPTSSSVTGVDRRPHLLPNDVSMEEVFSAILNGNPSPGRVSTPRNASRKQRTPFRAKSPPGSSSSSGRNSPSHKRRSNPHVPWNDSVSSSSTFSSPRSRFPPVASRFSHSQMGQRDPAVLEGFLRGLLESDSVNQRDARKIGRAIAQGR